MMRSKVLIMNLKRFFAICISTAICLALLTGCGNKKATVSADPSYGDELRIVLRCGEHILLLDMQTELSGTAAVVGKIGHANTTPFRWANWFAVSMTSLVS